MRRKWDKEDIILEAKKYNTVKEWLIGSYSSYVAAQKLKIIPEVSGHMNKLHKSWSEETIIADARKYNKRSAWKRKSSGAYGAAKRLGILDKAIEHMRPYPTTKISYSRKKMSTKEEIFETVRECNSLKEWKKNFSYGIRIAKHLGIYEEVVSYWGREHKIWTDEEVILDAKKYNTKKEWEHNSNSAYQICYRRNLTDIACSHMRVIGNTHKRQIYAIENPDNSVYVGLSQDPENRYYQGHVKESSTQKIDKLLYVQFLTGKQKLKIFDEWYSPNQARIEEGLRIEKYRKMGWNILNVAKHGALGGDWRVHTLSSCIELAKKVTNRTEFRKKYPGPYQAISRNGWNLKVFSNIPRRISKWNLELCKNDALKYNTRYEWQKKSKSAYAAACRNGWLDVCCKHMKIIRKKSTQSTSKIDGFKAID